jgi:hypothetical protein
MKALFVSLALVVAIWSAAFAADSDYDDPGMHFAPPAGWEKISLAPAPGQDPPSQDDDNRPPAAVYVYHRGQPDQRTIVINIQSFDGDLATFESAHESEMRKGTDGAFLDKPIKTSLANGMPVMLLKMTSGNDPGHFSQRYEYLMIDGTRSIAVSYFGRQGDFEKQDALDAFSSLYVVAYPRHHP